MAIIILRSSGLWHRLPSDWSYLAQRDNDAGMRFGQSICSKAPVCFDNPIFFYDIMSVWYRPRWLSLQVLLALNGCQLGPSPESKEE